VVMFGGYWSFFPALLCKIYGKHCCIILGGMDCVSFPYLRYGSLRKPILRWFIGCSYRWASRLLPVHESLVKSTNMYIANEQFRLQGFRHHFPNIQTPHTVIYNGFDVPDVDLSRPTKHPNSFILVAACENEMRLKLKGVDQMLAVAPLFPDCIFTLVGIHKSLQLKMNIPQNVMCHEFLPQTEFQHLLRSAEFILQPSLSEGFPNAICEGMLYGCIPIGSSVGALPEIIGDTGILVQHENELENALWEAIKMDANRKQTLALAARERIIRQFSSANRASELVSALIDN